MADGIRKVSGSGVEGKKNGFKFRARNELTTKRKSRKGIRVAPTSRTA